MVTRKPVGPPLSTANASQNVSSKANPPYPTSPVLDSAKSTASSNSIYSADLKNSPAFDLVDRETAKQRTRSDSDASSHGTWDSDDTMEQDDDTADYVEVPKPLTIRPSQQDINGKAKTQEDENKAALPASLRIGGAQEHRRTLSAESQKYEEEAQGNPWAGHDSNRSSTNGQLDSNNPYLQQNGFVGENSQSAWQDVKSPPMPSGAPPPPPSAAPPPPPSSSPAAPIELPTAKSPPERAPSQWLSDLSLDDHRPASWETAEVLSVPQKGQAPLPPVTQQDPPQDSQRPLSTWWQDSQPPQDNRQQSAFASPTPPYPIAEQDELVYTPPLGPPPKRMYRLIDHEDSPQKSSRPTPAPISTSQPTATTSSSSVPETPGTQLKRQRNEHYQIKHINWLDGSDSTKKPSLRNSPILTQNANGPCPLLALVNALVLSTPQSHNTALIETLQSREQVSLGLLLDAVFDELMSGRRGETAHQLPDVSDLYSFLLALHTGMNVNPRFVTPTETPRGSLDGHPAAINSVHPTHRAQRKAGAFEETKEMRLYSTFNVPLIHGWTAPPDTPAYEAFVRSAQTFEDAQNIQFAASELEDQWRSGGLSPQEQQTLHDIQTIKAFLDTWPTQLTDFGLQTISESLTPGQYAILFRNDHFSTIYKEPTHGALMTLVTDTGYSSHDEIVWESLVDVTGAASEMFSGDFRTVSHSQDVNLNQSSSAVGQEGWQTVQSRNRNQGQQNSGDRATSSGSQQTLPPLAGPRPNSTPNMPPPRTDGALDVPVADGPTKTSEQEDHDLALALQLQEEEEAQQREDEQRRRREQELSEQFLSNESEGPRPAIPPRRNGGRAGNGPTTNARTTTATTPSSGPTARPAVSRPADTTGDPDAPPSYEQAWSDRPYRPAGSTAQPNQGNPLSAYDALRRQHTPTAPGAPGEPASPSYYSPQIRRQSNNTRFSRRTSQMGGAGGPAVPGAYVNQATNAPGRVQQATGAPGVKDADDRCVIM